MLWLGDHQKALFWLEMSKFCIKIFIPWKREEISIFHDFFSWWKTSSDFPGGEKSKPHLVLFALLSDSHKIIYRTESFSFFLSNQNAEKTTTLCAFDLKKPDLLSEAPEVKNPNWSDESTMPFSAEFVLTHLAVLPLSWNSGERCLLMGMRNIKFEIWMQTS